MSPFPVKPSFAELSSNNAKGVVITLVFAKAYVSQCIVSLFPDAFLKQMTHVFVKVLKQKRDKA